MKKEMLSSPYLTRGSLLQKPTGAAWLRKSIIIEAISSLLIILFIYAALSKLWDYKVFRVQLTKSPFITSFSRHVAWSIPAVEIIIALLLAIKNTRLIGLYASFFLMCLFTAYLVAMLNFSYYIPCSCGGVLQYLSWNSHIVFNVFFIVISAAGVLLLHKKDNIAN